MRPCILLCAMVSLALAAEAGSSQEGPGKKPDTARIARLIQQLGHERFVQREAATKETRGHR